MSKLTSILSVPRTGHAAQRDLAGWLLGTVVVAAFGVAKADDVPRAEVNFSRQIQPLLAERCLLCHGPETQEAGLRLDDPESTTARLESGDRAVVPGQPDASSVLRRITSDDPDARMPPEGEPLADHEIKMLRDWVAQGAVRSQHWAYRPVQRPALPAIQASGWPQTPIDRFVWARLHASRRKPSASASRPVLIKRLYYDLLGLPPTLRQVEAFVQDTQDDAYSRLVDQLLASPRFGERWGRHWLDKARYADSDGYEKDRPRPHAWRYRDWVIDAVNRDMPLDQFTRAQLAGDLLPDASDAELQATAFHRQTLTNTEGGADQEEFRVAAVMDRVETTAAVWLGLTVGCARCHDHKYDDITQKDYYGLFAFFDNADEVTQEMRIGRPSSGDNRMPVAILRERREERRTTHILRRGDFLQPTDPVMPQFLPILPTVRSADGDRRDLVAWLMSRDNPLTARVFANQIWSKLFGQGLVATLTDFGVRGDRPTHPLLLDWLASELYRNGWSRKELIRTIVLSATYRQASVHQANTTDPTNRLLGRQNRFRIEAELVRDMYLALGGLLTDEVGGPSVFPYMTPDVAALSYANSFKWQTSPGGNAYRRGLYTFFKRTAPHPNLTTFDCPDANTASLTRTRSNSPLQALVTLNHSTFMDAARGLGRRLQHDAGKDQDRARILWGLRTCGVETPQQPTVDEVQRLLDEARRHYAQQATEAIRLVGESKQTSVDPAESASWIVVARCLLNLESVLVRE